MISACPRSSIVLNGMDSSTKSKIIRKSSPFTQMSQRLGLLSTQSGLNEIMKVSDEGTQTVASSPLDEIRRSAEFVAHDLVNCYVDQTPRKPPNRYCKTLRRTVKELTYRHELVFKGMVNRLKPDEKSTFPTFVIVADEIFDDGQVNWGRIVAVYAFAARLAQYHSQNISQSSGMNTKSNFHDKIALFVGKYVATKLGQWILDHGGWDAFVEYFPDQGEFEEKMWKGILYTALGLGALATVVASR